MSKVYRGTLFNDECRFYLSDSTDVVQAVNEKNTFSPTAIAALGRTMMITNILGLMQKDDAKVSSIINGGGPIGTIIATADAKGNVKGKVTNPLVDVPKISDTKLDVGAAVGKEGSLKVIKDLNLKDPFVTDIPLVSGEIGIDFTNYFTTSEQVPTAIAVGVLVDKDHSVKDASVFVVQLLPDASEDTIVKLEKFFNKFTSISSEMANMNEEQFLEKHFPSQYNILEVLNNQFKCDCSYDKFLDALKMLPPADIIDLKQDETIECCCDFCAKKYDIKSEEI